MGGEDRTVQVPVSLIRDALDTSASGVHRRVAAVSKLRALLLSQPAPADEPASYPDVWNAAIDRAQEELVRQDQFSERTLRILDEQRIPDSSTIRDVTPPAVTP